jgi:hypothetical protein
MDAQSYPFLIKNAVSPEVLDHVTEVTLLNWGRFKGNKTGDGSGRQFLVVDFVTPEGDRLLFDVKQELAARYDLGAYVVPPGLMDFINVITEGGFVHEHTDPDLPGRAHVRINVVVKQTAGCLPLLDGIPIAVGRGDAWLNLASRCKHATTPVEGPGYRSAISFGFQIDANRGHELYRIHQQWLADVCDKSAREPAAPETVGKKDSDKKQDAAPPETDKHR